MKYAIWLSGEHPELPYGELKGAVEAEGAQITGIEGRIAMVEGDNAEMVFSRMGFAKRSALLIASGSMVDIKKAIEKSELPEGSFAVRCWKYGDFQGSRRDVERKIGMIVAEQRKINLEDPDNILSLYLGNTIFAGIELQDCRNLAEREPDKRPFFYPITLGPKMARALINLSRVRRGGRLLDPFCGTGAILIEAGLLGIRAIGSDFDPNMIRGCGKNLRFYGVDAELHVMDISDIKDIKVKHIATDPPYGRSSSTGKEEVEGLYSRMFDAFGESMKNGYLSIILPDLRYSALAESFTLTEEYEFRVHRSLIRHFCVFRRN